MSAVVGPRLGLAGLLGLLVLAPGAGAQARPADEAPEAGAAARTSGDADGPSDPSFWIHDPEGPARRWLDKPLLDPADLVARLPEFEEMLATHGLLLDLEVGSLAVRGATLHDGTTLGYPIEYLVVTEQGKTHEAAVLVRAQPSVIDACLAALGLEPGAATHFVLKDPQPPEEEVEAGRVSAYDVLPATGPLVDIGVTWIDEAGVPQETSLESMLIDLRTGLALEEHGWVYTGSRYGQYRQGREMVSWLKADVEGDVVAIYLTGLDVCLFERNSLDGLDDSLYTLNDAVMPPRHTPVTLILRPTGRVLTRADRPRRSLPPAYPEEQPDGAADAGGGSTGTAGEGGDADG